MFVELGVIVKTVGALNDIQPLTLSVTCTVYDPDVVAVIEAVVAPVLQEYDVPPLAVKTTYYLNRMLMAQ